MRTKKNEKKSEKMRKKEGTPQFQPVTKVTVKGYGSFTARKAKNSFLNTAKQKKFFSVQEGVPMKII